MLSCETQQYHFESFVSQAPVFISFFLSLKGMTNVPVDSMRTGGMLWFLDLTLPDQYYLLSLITSTTLWITIEVCTLIY